MPPRVLQSATTSDEEIEQLFDGSTPPLTPSPSLTSVMDEDTHDVPPHLPEQADATTLSAPSTLSPTAFGPQLQPTAAPVFDPQLQQAILMIFQAMAAQIQYGMMAVQAPAPAPRPRPLTVPALKPGTLNFMMETTHPSFKPSYPSVSSPS